MESLLEILRKSEEFLARKGVPEARLDAEHLLSTALSCRRMDLYLQFDRPLGEEILEKVRPLLARRARREPLSHIIGLHPFHDLMVRVGPAVLCPRPETEELVERTLEEIQGDPKRILDLGTGSGAIALWMKKRFPNAEVVGTDRSADALAVARANGERLDLGITWVQTDWLEGLDGPFELILANPPYLTPQEWEESAPEVRDHEPKEALVSGADGLEDLGRIVTGAGALLAEEGLLALETGIDHREPLQRLAGKAGYSSFRGVDDFSGRQRFFFCRP